MIGILGGTFDPIHYGHLRAAVEVKERLGLAQVCMIPCAQPPHRDVPAASAQQRLAMLQLALASHAGLVADDREIKRGGVSYMIDTLASLRQDYPQQPLLLFIGDDAFSHLAAWKRWQDLFALAHVVVITRPGYSNPPLCSFLSAKLAQSSQPLSENLAGQLYFQAITPLDIAATAIRQMIAGQHNPAFLLPDTVIAYINQQKLYHPIDQTGN